MKTATKTIEELNESYIDFLNAFKGTNKEMSEIKKLWRDGNKSRLVKLGLALIVFPEPTPISETLGACLVAAGTVQRAIQNRAIYVEDIMRTFRTTLEEMKSYTGTL